MKSIAALFICLASVISAWWWFANPSTSEPVSEYRTETITEGNITNSVSATGTLAAVDDVIVGAQLSGQITHIYADFNDTVEAGQLLAQIDPSTFAAKVAQAQAQVDKSHADIGLQKITVDRAKLVADKAQRDLTRAQALLQSKHISEDELDTLQTAAEQSQLDVLQTQAQLEVLEATLQANKASLLQNQIELSRTEIRAPIDGFVISRTIEAGQTVASSLNTPELFMLAKDLSVMEIEAYIDESDIGQLQERQRVNFSVDAFPDRQFRGQINQIRRSPQTTSGVVSYTVIISADNQNGILLPGMTANLEISIDNVRDVTRIPDAAVRLAARLNRSQDDAPRGPMTAFKGLGLTESQQQQIAQKLPKRAERSSSMASQPTRENRSMSSNRASMMQDIVKDILTPDQRELYRGIQQGNIRLAQVMILRDNQVETIDVQLGVSDGQYSELLSPDLSQQQIITQVKASAL